EIDKYARQSYKAMYDTTNEEELHDITQWTDGHIRQFVRDRGHIDCITGGFPCQIFSISGKRCGFADTLGNLFFEIMRIADIVRPRYLFLENVKGLLNHDGGATFETILNTLDEFGYDAEWSLLNSKNFGVPQNRERVFIIGHLRGAGGRTVFPVGEINGEMNELQRQPISTNTLTARYEGVGNGSYVIESEQHAQKVNEESLTGEEQGVIIDDTQGFDGTRTYKNIAPTIRSQRSGLKVIDNLRIRKLTPLECWRLQGFTDEQFYKAKDSGVSNSQLYKQAGNSVTVNVIDAIVEEVFG